MSRVVIWRDFQSAVNNVLEVRCIGIPTQIKLNLLLTVVKLIKIFSLFYLLFAYSIIFMQVS